MNSATNSYIDLVNPTQYVFPINIKQEYNIELLWRWQEGFFFSVKNGFHVRKG